jgi:hypothetical protein
MAAEPSQLVAVSPPMRNPRKKPPAPSLRRSLRETPRCSRLTTELRSSAQRRALGLLASAGRNGVTGPLLAAHGFSAAAIMGLIGRGLATMAQEKVKAGGKLVAVARVRITDAGRAALPADG